MFTRNLRLGLICLLLVLISSGCTEESDNDGVDQQGGGGAGALPQSGSDGIVQQAGTGGMTQESGSGPQAGTGPTGGVVVDGSGGAVPGGSGGVDPGGSGGNPTTGGTGPIEGPCPVEPDTTGIHIVVNISWAETVGVLGGDGQLHIWVKSKSTPGEIQADGSYELPSESLPCGSLLPALVKSDLIGGGQMFIDIPWEAFDSPSMKSSPTTGTVSSADIGATFDMNPNVTQIGLDLPDPLNYVWPDLGSEMVEYVTDAEGDGKPGITGVPRANAPFTLPPTDLAGALLQTGLADRLYLAVRSVVKLTGTRESCDRVSGTAEVTAFDNHVIGCRLRDTGTDCDVIQSDFVDVNRTVYELHEGTYEQVKLAENATCADVLAAFPPPEE